LSLPQPRWVHELAAEDYRRQRRYWPARYAVHLVGTRWRQLQGAAAEEPDHPDPASPETQRLQARLLLAALEGSPVDLSAWNIVLFQLNSHGQYHGLLELPLRETLGTPSLPSHLRRMQVLDLASELGPEHWYILDDHLRPSGHRLIADRLAQLIQGPTGASVRGHGTASRRRTHRVSTPRRAHSGRHTPR
jgi:hypothetical protein